MPEYFREMMEEAKGNGLTALALTEHFNTTRFYDIYRFLDENYSYSEGFYNIAGLKLFPGIEVDVKEVGHILLIGDRKDIVLIWEQLEPHLQEESFISFNELMDLADRYGVLKIGGHPYRESTPLAKNVTRDQLRRLDALDLNGKDLYTKGIETCKKEVEALAVEIKLPIVGGSDTHQFLQYGSVVNDFEEECSTSDELKQLITNRRYQIQIAEQLPLKVKSATLVKKYMKKALKEADSLTV